jgi:hypothetical protein
MSDWPKVNWWVFNRISLMPCGGVFLLVAGAVEAMS